MPSDFPASFSKPYRPLMRESAPLAPHVFGLRLKYEKVIGAIVEFISVDVMNDFSAKKSSTYFLFRHDPMNVLSSHAKVNSGVNALVGSTAFLPAIFSAAFSLVAQPQEERLTAVDADCILPLPTNDRRAKLRAERSLARLAANIALVHTIIINTPGIAFQWFSPHCLSGSEEPSLFQPAAPAGRSHE